MGSQIDHTSLAGWNTAWAPRLPEVDAILARSRCLGNADDMDAAMAFRTAMASWIACGPSLDWSGCQEKSQWAMCNGIHDALVQQISYRHDGRRRFVTFTDDYRYYKTLLSGKPHAEISWSDLDRLGRDDYVIVSWPNHHGMLDGGLSRLVRACRRVDASIFLDCAFYGTVGNGITDTSDPVFDAVAFSVSKAFQLGGLRAGIVWGNDLAPSLTVPMRDEYSVYNITSALIATEVITAIPADTLPRICNPVQEAWCRQNDMLAADVCFFAIGHGPEHASMLRRGGDYARICISDYLQSTIGKNI